jgi:hypothetical protein
MRVSDHESTKVAAHGVCRLQFFNSLDPEKLPPGVASIEAFKEQLQQSFVQTIQAMRQQQAR